MWQVGSSGFCLLLTLLLAPFSVAAQRPPNSSIHFPRGPDNNGRQQCRQPVDPRMYKKCRAVVTPGGRQLICECAKCALDVQLTCRDGLWTPPPGPNLCNATSPAHGCGRCVPTFLLHDVTSRQSHEGYLGETRRGNCLQTCLDVVLTCHMDGLWHYDCRVPTRQVIPEIHLSLTFDSDSNFYTFSCTPGMTLVGASRLSCVNGTFNGLFPQCIVSDMKVQKSPQQFHFHRTTIRGPATTITSTTRTPRYSITPPPPHPSSTEGDESTPDPNSIPPGPTISTDGFAEYEETYDDSNNMKKTITLSLIDIILIAFSLIVLLLVIIACIFIKVKYYSKKSDVEFRQRRGDI